MVRPLALATVCRVTGEGWLRPHLAVRAWFTVGRWRAQIQLAQSYSLVWSASRLSVLDNLGPLLQRSVRIGMGSLWRLS